MMTLILSTPALSKLLSAIQVVAHFFLCWLDHNMNLRLPHPFLSPVSCENEK